MTGRLEPASAVFSVLILTLNEERNLPRCLASIPADAGIVLLDSGSTDRTCAIAEAAGARVFTRQFDDFARQRNFAHEQIPFHHDWVFHLDADECLTPALIAECVANRLRDDVDGFLVAPKMLFEGHWIPHCTDYPAYQARFVHARRFRFVQVGHGQREAAGMRLARLRENYLHDLSAGGTDEWLDKHRRYARQEAAEHVNTTDSTRWLHLLSRDALVRRRTIKRLSYRLPCRPSARFLYQYVLRGGFLDGRAGLRYCRLLMRYEEFTRHELRRLRPVRQ